MGKPFFNKVPQSHLAESSFFRPRVWAPRSSHVELVVRSGALPASARYKDVTTDAAFRGQSVRETMKSNSNGWWEALHDLPAGSLYGFSLNGEKPLPDPRSRFQPEGVHSWSEVWLPSHLDHGKWTGLNCLGKVFYELHVGTFTSGGTFRAAQEKLSYLRDIGVEVVEIMPVAAFEGSRGWGYDQVLPFAVQASYGGPNDLAQFVAAAHREGLAVCLDIVLNHLGNSGCYAGKFGPYFLSEPTIWGNAFDLSQPGEPVEYLSDAALWWLEAFGIDALRLDAIHAISAEGRKRLMDAITAKVQTLSEPETWPRTLIAESDLNQVSLLDTLGLDGLWNDDFHHALHGLFTGESHGYYADFANRHAVVKVINETYFHNGTYSSFRKKHWGQAVPREVKQNHFVVFSSNHDQVGNRPFGDRPASYISPAAAAALAALTVLSPFTPLLFMGEEYGATTPFQFFSDPLDEQNAQKLRAGRLQEFAAAWDIGTERNDGTHSIFKIPAQLPDPTAESTFQNSKLNWQESETDRGRSFRNWYHDLIALRHRAQAGEFLFSDVHHQTLDCSPYHGEAFWENEVLILRSLGLRVEVNFGSPSAAIPQNILLNWNDYAEGTSKNSADVESSPETSKVSQIFVSLDSTL